MADPAIAKLYAQHAQRFAALSALRVEIAAFGDGVVVPAELVAREAELVAALEATAAALRMSRAAVQLTTEGGDVAGRDIDSRRGNFISGGTFHGDVIGEQTIVASGLSPRDRDNRRRMLKQVREFWITGVLEQSLYREVLITLNLHTNPQAVGFTGPRLAARRAQEAQPLPPGATIAQVYQTANQRLLILGVPGGGKTTLLLELARHLLDLADCDETRPIPALFNLSSWAQQRRPLEQWLIQELRDQYGVAQRIARQWLTDNRVLPLLDGLDEVAEPQRAACVAAINRFLQEHGGEGLVVCSRSADYEALGQHLLLDQAVQLQLLDDAQLDAYLAWAGAPLAGVRAVLGQDTELRELARAPLLLNVLILAYEGQRPEALLGLHAAVQRHHLFDRYIQRMFDRPARPDPKHYTRDQTLRWLRWLARRMKQDQKTIFQIELMQPWWLRRWWQRGLYILFTIIGTAVSGAILGGLFGLFQAFVWGVLRWCLVEVVKIDLAMGHLLTNMLPIALALGSGTGFSIGLIGGLTVALFQRAPSERGIRQTVAGVGLATVLAMVLWGVVTQDQKEALPFWGVWGVLFIFTIGRLIKRGTIQPTEVIRWSGYKVRENGYIPAVFSLLVSIAGSLSGLSIGLSIGFFFGLPIGLILWCMSGITQEELQQRAKPNQGIWYSLGNALVAWLVTELIVGLVSGLMSGIVGIIVGGLSIGLTFGLFVGLLNGTCVAPIAALYFGGLTFVQHFALRLVCKLCNKTPWSYPYFLDYAVDRILLRRVGGSYIFVHRMLLEHFAQDEQPLT